MTTIDLRSLVGKFDERCRQALEAAAGLTLSRTHYNVEIEHWLLKLLEAGDADLTTLLRHYEIDPARVAADLGRVLDRLKTGNSRPPALSPQIVALGREAWLLASLEWGAERVRSGHLLCALLNDETLARLAREASPQLAKINGEALRRDLPKLVEHATEAAEATTPGGGAPPRAVGTAALDQFTINLTELARAGKIDPVLGRDPEIRQVIDILTRRRQNNPILTGEAGVGKTAVAEGFALRIAAKEVPESLRNVELRTLDLGLLQAGAGMKGEFENRLKGVIDEVRASPKPIILFIDEAHTLIGAGGQAGQNDAANLLKPALARGELRTVAATTWAEYKKYFERDAALTRRFQVVKVEEPTEPTAIEMMRGLVGMLETHHKVRILDEAVVESVRLSKRYISGRQLPDKAVSLLDTACARVSMSQTATPAAVEDQRRRLEQLDVEIRIALRETATNPARGERLAECRKQRDLVAAGMVELEGRWAKERDLAVAIAELRQKIETAKPDDGGLAEWRTGYQDATARLRSLQGEAPMLHVCVDAGAIAAVVATWTGIPVGRMVGDEIRAVMGLRERLEERVVGQTHALEAIAQAVRTSRAKLTDPRKPLGVFLMCGTSGVGKTETALALAELLYGGEHNLTVINMSEFKEEHKVSLLMGSPPGYVGYGEGGVLTEAVRRRPYSVVLLDEMEKAHPGVQDIFYQVFDKGQLKDGEGRDIDFKNTLIIMTSNAGTDTIASLCADPETMPAEERLTEALRPELMKWFKPAFLGRCTVVPYFPLSDENLKRIVRLNLERVRRRIDENYHALFSYTPELVDVIAARCKETESGARVIERILNRTLLPQLAGDFLSRLADGTALAAVEVGVGADGTFVTVLR